jgi:hypothetical protein
MLILSSVTQPPCRQPETIWLERRHDPFQQHNVATFDGSAFLHRIQQCRERFSWFVTTERTGTNDLVHAVLCHAATITRP